MFVHLTNVSIQKHGVSIILHGYAPHLLCYYVFYIMHDCRMNIMIATEANGQLRILGCFLRVLVGKRYRYLCLVSVVYLLSAF